jgi:putative flavoprotein involved in K+ transport
MEEKVDVVVIGAGQAGIVASYLLKQAGIEHQVFERGKIAESWRSQRWDSFCLNTPNWTNGLPGMEFLPEDAQGFGNRDQIIAYFDDYVQSNQLPIRENTTVTSLDQHPSGFTIQTTKGVFQSKAVILANGSTSEPNLPAIANDFPDELLVLSAGTYKNPTDLPKGAVLVVGSGQSGCQIAEDLLEGGRQVYLCASSVGRVPRTYRGRDSMDWFVPMGMFEVKVEELEDPAMQFAAQPQVSGTDGGHTVRLQSLARDGALLLGRGLEIDGHILKLGNDLRQCIEFADEKSQFFKDQVDRYIEANSIDAEPAQPDPGEPDLPDLNGSDLIDALDLQAAGISTVIFCTGFHSDWSWINLDVFDEHGRPIHKRGITPIPGLYCLGYVWLSKRKSAILYGVTEDAERVVDHIEKLFGDSRKVKAQQ